MDKIVFNAYSPFIKQLRSDKGWRVEFEVSQSDYDSIKDLPKLEGRILKISIEESELDKNQEQLNYES